MTANGCSNERIAHKFCIRAGTANIDVSWGFLWVIANSP